MAYLPLGHLGHAPLPLQKNATKMRHFQAKISKIFCGGGIAPSPDPTPTGERNTPDQTPHPRVCGASPRPHLKFFPNFYHYARLRCCYWRIWEIKSSDTVLLVDLGLLNGTRLEVAPVNIQSSHCKNVLMQLVIDWRTLANSIINIQHSFCITLNMYTSKHTFSMTILWNITCNWAGKSLKLLVPDVRF